MANESNNLYLEIAGVTGSSTASGHAGQIALTSFGQSFVQTTSNVHSTNEPATVARANHGDVTVTKVTDESTPALMKRCWTGEEIPELTIHQIRSTGAADDYITIRLERVTISSFSINSFGEIPSETIGLHYSKITFTYGAVGGAVPVFCDLGDHTYRIRHSRLLQLVIVGIR